MWIKCSDFIPRKGEIVCIYTEKDGFIPFCHMGPDGEWISHYLRWSGSTVTHWMPIPRPTSGGCIPPESLPNKKNIPCYDCVRKSDCRETLHCGIYVPKVS